MTAVDDKKTMTLNPLAQSAAAESAATASAAPEAPQRPERAGDSADPYKSWHRRFAMVAIPTD